MKTQNDKVLERLKQGPITPLDALVELGVMRLGARVFELRQQGHIIFSKTVEVQTRLGGIAHVAEYRLEERGAQQ